MISVFRLPRGVPRENQLSALSQYLRDLPMDHGWKIEIGELKPLRSHKQNRTLWWIYDTILERGGEKMGGWERKDLHEFFLCNHFGTEVRELFGKRRQVPRRRSSGLGKIEFAEYVESIYRFMANEGVVLPSPDPEMAIYE